MDTTVDCNVSCDSDSNCVAQKPEKEVLRPEQTEADEIQLLFLSRYKSSDKPNSLEEPETPERNNGIFSTLHFSSQDQKVASDADRDTQPEESTVMSEDFIRNPVFDKSVDTEEHNFEEPALLPLHKHATYKPDIELSTSPSSTDIPDAAATNFVKHDSFADLKGPVESYLTVSALSELDSCETEVMAFHNDVCANSIKESEIQGSYQQAAQFDSLQDEDHNQIMTLLSQLKTFQVDCGGGERLCNVEYFSSFSDLGQHCGSEIVKEAASCEELHRNICEGRPDEKASGYLCSLSEYEFSNQVDSGTSLSHLCESKAALDSHGLLFEAANQREFVNLLDARAVAVIPASCIMYAADLSSYQPCEKGLTMDSTETNYGELQPELCKVGSHTGYRRTDETCLQPVRKDDTSCMSPCSPEGPPEPMWMKMPVNSKISIEELQRETDTSKAVISYPTFKEVPGPCEKEDLLDGVIFGAKYLGSTQLFSEKNPSTNVRMTQAQEAVDRIKAPEGESQPMTEVDLFISSKRIKVLNAETQEAMMDHLLQTISYIADIGNIVVIMARRKQPRKTESDTSGSVNKRQYKMICHVFQSEDAQMIAQAIGQAFSVAYQLFLQSNGINPSELRPNEYSDVLSNEELYNGDLIHFSKQENCRDIFINKERGELLGVAIVESGWGSILPTVVIANLMHGGPAERSGELNIGDRIMSINGVSLVGLPLAACENIIRDLKYHTEVKLNIVHCPPVTMAIIKRPDTKHQLGFCVEEGIICSLMRGGIAERGGIRVGHRIIEINGQSVVATPHEKIIKILSNAIGEIHLKTMPASTYRLLTGQEQPVYL